MFQVEDVRDDYVSTLVDHVLHYLCYGQGEGIGLRSGLGFKVRVRCLPD